MIWKISQFVLISLVITLLIAIGLILSQRPKALSGAGGLDFEQTLAGARAGGAPQPLTTAQMRDSYALHLRHYPNDAPDVPLVVMVHGSGWHGLQFDDLARDISKNAEVLAPDLRGHGTQPGTRGDIAYIGQFEDDLADLIQAHRRDGQKLILLGHSSGGGLVVRFAGGEHGAMLDGAVLLAPFLKHNAPMTRPNSGGWTQVLLRRIIGLSILNAFKITALNHLTIMQFNMPAEVLNGPLGDTATTAYSYRLNTSFAPRGDYLGDVAALPNFLLVAGAGDEAFDAALYASTLQPVTDKGQYHIIPDVAHLDIVDAPETAGLIRKFLNEY